MTYDYSSTVLFIGGERIGVGSMSMGAIVEEFGEGSEIERAINFSRADTGTIERPVNRASWDHLKRALRTTPRAFTGIVRFPWRCARLPLSGRRWCWREPSRCFEVQP